MTYTRGEIFIHMQSTAIDWLWFVLDSDGDVVAQGSNGDFAVAGKEAVVAFDKALSA